MTIYTLGTSGALNSGGALNLTGITYVPGVLTSLDLAALAADPTGSTSLQFGFNPARTLTSLKTSGGFTTFSGDLTNQRRSVPDGGTTAMLLGGAFLAIGVLRRKLA